MDFGWIVGLVSAIGVSTAGILAGLAQLKKQTIPQSDLFMWARSVWDWIVFTGQEPDVPEHIREGAREHIRRPRDDDQGTTPKPLGIGGFAARRRATGRDDHHDRDVGSDAD